jgi:hypothetical protein
MDVIATHMGSQQRLLLLLTALPQSGQDDVPAAGIQSLGRLVHPL